MTSKEIRNLLNRLLDRGPERIELARKLLRRKYPNATDQMLSAAVFHLFVDGIDACVEWLADLERFLSEDEHRLGHGTSSHVLYHVYNWHQLEALLPHGKSGMHELLDDILESAEDGNLDGVKRAAAEFKNLLEGNEMPPDFEAS